MSLKMRFYLALAIGCGILSVRLNAASPATNFAATPLPPIESWTPCMTVDEPLGPTYSIGFTLWHLNHNPETIQRFQAYVKSHKLDVGSPSLTPPKSTYQILIDPELIPMNELPSWGWKKEGEGLSGANADDGPSFSLPLQISRTGLYRLGIRYEGWTNLTGGTRLRVYLKGREADGPVINEEYYHQPAVSNGLNWHCLMADLNAGEYVMTFSYVVRQWQAPKTIGYAPRKIECLYLTDAWMDDLPNAETLDALRKSSAPKGIQWTREMPLDTTARSEWAQRALRPADWDQARSNPKLFQATYCFWREELDRLAADDQSNSYDYRDLHRQVIFDDVWNLLGNPWRVRQQARELGSDVRSGIKPQLHYVINGARIGERSGGKECDWWSGGDKLVSGTYYNFQGEAVYTEDVEPGHTYYFWVQFRNMGYFEPWQLWVGLQGNPTNELHWKRDQRNYPPDIDSQRSWVKIGYIEVPANATHPTLRWHIANLPWPNLQGVSYRWIHNFHITTDPNYVPRGQVMPPESAQQYLGRAKSLGATSKDAFLCQFVEPFPMGQTWWPNAPQCESPSNSLIMVSDAYQSAQLGFRSVVDEPVSVTVEGGRLEGDGGSYAEALTWRTVAYTPYGPTRAMWSGWSLLRRPFITLPPFNTAALWLTLNSKGIKPGVYKAWLKLSSVGRNSGKKYATRTVALNVRISPVKLTPKSPTLVHGYTMPPEGEAYLQDYQAHGFKVWCGDLISKTEMDRRGMLLQQVRARASNGDYQPLLDSIKAMGLVPSDYYMIVWDEPSGANEVELGKFIATAKRLHEWNPGIRRVFNPGEPATLKTFQLLDPYCEIWMPYYRHFFYHPNEAAAKTRIITAKPWMEYTTPCYGDKDPSMPSQLYSQIRKVPANPGTCLGTWFFALYYPFRDPWDTGNEYLNDVSVFVIPSRLGPVSTISWEMMREAIQHADLAQLAKERAPIGDKESLGLIANGSVKALIEWLESHP
jgi:hypothetical protein